MDKRIASFLRLCLLTVLLAGAALQPQYLVDAATALTVEPITWNVIGLDSNNPAVGPYRFPVGVRACNPGSNSVTMADIEADFVWLAGGTTNDDSIISLRTGSLDPIAPNPQINLAPGACTDFYFEVEVNRSAASPYNQTRRYRIDVTYDDPDIAGIQTASSITPRELFVEHLISQSRNAITNVRLNGAAIPAGGTMSLMVGNTYTITLEGGTATQGYNQFEAFINFPNTIFQVLSVNTTYSADDSPYVSNPNSRLYADACKWENDPNSPNYRSCIGGDYKAGGSNVVTTYTIKIIGGGGTTQTLNTLLYDFSGSSYHYNADYSLGARFASIIDPTNVNIAKGFSPNPTNINGVSALTITLTNPNPSVITGYNFTDPLPANMTVANPPGATTTSCGTPTFAPTAGATSLSFSNGTIAANGSCTIKVNVTPSTTGSFLNTTNHLFVDSLDTGKFANSTLTVNSTPPLPPPPASCTTPVELARWEMPTTGQGSGGPPPPYTSKASDVATATASYVTVSGAQSLVAVAGSPANSWGGTAPTAGNGWSETPSSMANYFQFALDTQNYGGVYVVFDVGLFPNGDWANPTSNIYVNTSANGGAFTVFTPYPQASKGAWAPGLTASAASTGTNTTTFRFGTDGASKTTAVFYLDNVIFYGCPRPTPATITKAFSTNPIPVNGTSTLTFTLSNSNTTALTGATFTDTLPTGLQVAATPSATTTCGGTPTWAPAAGATLLTFGSPTGGTIPASGSCTVSVNVTGTTAGAYQNVSGFLSTTDGGTNTGSTGSASASLTVISPPSISKLFSPNPILSGGTSTLTFTITNPNQSNGLTGVAFTDTFPTTPGQMRVAATPNASTTNCGTPTFAPVANAVSISFSNGTIAVGAICTIKVDVTVPSTPTSGSYANTSSAVSSTNGGTGNTASNTLTVNAPNPSIALYKQIGPAATGPWSKFLGVTLPGSVYYLFTIENTGDVPLSPVSMTDPMVSTAGCTWPATLPVAVAANNNHIATCVVGPVTASSGSTTNTATASGTYNSTPHTSTSSSARYASQALTITKNVTESYFATAGDILHYSFIVANTGFAPLVGPVTVTDDHIVGAISCQAVSSATLIAGGGPGDGDDYLDPGEQVVCPATGTVNYTTTATDVTNKVVTNNAYGTVSGVNSPSVSRSVPLAQLTIDKDTTTGTIDANGDVVYTVVVVNTGQADLTNFQISDVLPVFGGTSAVLSVTAPGYTVNGSYTGIAPNTDLLAGTDTLAVGATATITITVDLVNATLGTYDNSATVTTTQTGSIDDDGLIGGDPGTPGIGADPETDEDVTVSALSAPTVTKSFAAGDLAAGGNTNLTVTIGNSNGSAITLTSALIDTFPTGMTINTAGNTGTCTGVTATAGADNFTIANGTSIPSGGCTVIVNITSNTAGVLTNTIPAGALQTSAGNNASPATSPLNVYAPPTVAKSFGVASIPAGGNTTLTLTLTNPNTNPGALTTVRVDDTFPTGLTLQNTTFNFAPAACGTVTNTGGGASAVGDGNVRFSAASLAVGANCQVVMNVTSSTVGAITNTTNTPTASGPVALTGTTASANLTVAALPDLTVTKSNNVSGLVAQSGSFNWTITVTNSGAGTANFANTNVIMSDTLPGVAGYYPQGALAVTPGATAPTGTINCSIAGTALSCVANGAVTLPAGASFSVTFAVTPTAAGSLVNTAIVDPGGVVSESNKANNTGANTVGVVDAVKTIVSTSEPATGYIPTFERVVIGEVIRYRLTTSLPEGTWTNVQITDAIDTGMQFLNDGTAVVSYVCDGVCANSQFTVTPGAFASSTDPTFNLGTVSNPDADVNTEFLIVEFNVLVLNWPTSTSVGPTRNNSYSISFNGTTIISSAVGVRISEPSITNLAKTVLPAAGPYYPGDIITYTLTYSNGSTGVTRATAFDVFVADTLSTNLNLQSVSVTALTGSTVTDTSTIGAGGVVRILVNQVPPSVDIASGPTGVTITVVAQVVNSAPAGTLSNTADLTYTSLPGGTTTGDTNGTCPNVTGSCTPGTSGSTTGERNGTGGAPNTYVDTATVDITVTPRADLSLTKTVDTAAPNVGTNVTFTITVTNAGPSVATNVAVSDLLPAGLTYVSSTPSQGAYNSGTGIWTIGTINSGTNATLGIVATVTNAGAKNNYAQVSTVDQIDPDSTPNDNSTTQDDDDTVLVTPVTLVIDAVNDDYSGTPINGNTGGNAGNAFTNDTLNGVAVIPAQITATVITPASNAGVTLNTATGSVDVAAGTPAGTYNIVYQICEVINPTNCDTATITIAVNLPPIDAVNDNFSSTPVNGYTGGTTATVYTNDTLNGAPFVPADVTPSITNDGGIGVTINANGTLNVPAGTPAGTYTVTYQICETANLTNCDTATATIVINPPAIDAVDDNYSATPLNGYVGGNAGNAFANDTLNGVAVIPAQITATVVAPAANAGVTLNTATGSVDVATGSPTGTYTIVYQICENLNPTNCDTATITVVVVPPVIDAVNDDYSSTPVNGYIGGNAGNAFTNDTLNGVAVVPAQITATVVTPASNAGVTLNPSTGNVDVAAGTPAGTYTIDYRICENLNPTNCDNATITVVVNPSTIDAVNDDYSGTPVNGYIGGNAGNAFVNDTLNGVAIIPAQITATVVTPASDPGVTLNTVTGSVDVVAGTPAGTYTIVYRICEILNPTNCDNATITVVVEPPAIDAVNDNYSGTPINGSTGGNAGNAFMNDTLNGVAVVPAQITATVITPASDPGVTLNPATGSVDVAAGTPAGAYTIVYQICENLNPTNCDNATITVVVNPPAIDAVNDDYSGTPIDGSAGGNAGDAFTNDTLNGVAVVPAQITATVLTPASNPGVTLNTATGSVDVAAGTPAGTYSIVYQICENLNPANCDTATVTVVVNPPASIGGVVFHDANLNGTKAGSEAGLVGVTVQLYDSTGTTLIATTTTGPGGTYNFPSLTPGSYRVIETDPAGYVSSTANSVPVAIAAGGTGTANFGDYQLPNTALSNISGVVFNDINGNGIQDAGELPLNGVTVELKNNLGVVIGTASTNALGAYSFTNLPAGTYTVVETDPPGYVSTTLNNVAVNLSAGTNATVHFGDQVNAALIADPAVTKFGSPTNAVVGDTVVYTITVGNNGNTNASNVVLTDTKPSFLDLVSITISPNPGLSPVISGNTFTINFGTVTPTDFYTITVLTRVNALGVPPGGANTVQLATSSATDRAFNNTSAAGLIISAANPATSSSIPATGFAPNVRTELSPQPQELKYVATDITLEIPSLGVNLPIVGVSKKNGLWDVTWLGNQAGWLEGTAFPSWDGNSVLTSHVYLSNGLPGPFVSLNKLKYGDKLIVHAYGQKYTFEVRTNVVVEPNDASIFKHEEKSWLTLVTCKEYDEKTNTYKKRVVVRAVLVSVDAE